MVTQLSKGAWAVAANDPAGSVVVAVRATFPRRFLMCLTTCLATLWAVNGVAADGVPHAVPICATTSGSRSKMRTGACKSRSMCPPRLPVIPAAAPGRKAAQSRRPVPLALAWAKSARSKVSSPSNAPAPPVRAWARSSRTRVNPAVALAASKKTAHCL